MEINRQIKSLGEPRLGPALHHCGNHTHLTNVERSKIKEALEFRFIMDHTRLHAALASRQIQRQR